jgi:hypothetical protein
VPGCVAGFAGGALPAPPPVALLGLDATLVLTGAVLLAHGAPAHKSADEHGMPTEAATDVPHAASA